MTAMLRALALSLVLALVVTGCTSDAEPGAEPTASADPSSATDASAAEGYLPVPDKVTLTEPGSALDLGQRATVAWQASADEVGVLDLAVREVEQARPQEFRGWLRDDAMRRSTPYFVQVRVRNRGEGDLGGAEVPLLLLDDNGTLGPPWTFGARFAACPSRPLPRSFEPGDRADLCLVYLAPRRATIEAMAFEPVDDFEAITWTGKVRKPGDGGDEDKARRQDRRR
jgi:hypothetical protein